jgi:hypothetical protein
MTDSYDEPHDAKQEAVGIGQIYRPILPHLRDHPRISGPRIGLFTSIRCEVSMKAVERDRRAGRRASALETARPSPQ